MSDPVLFPRLKPLHVVSPLRSIIQMSQFRRRSSAPLARKGSGRDYPAPCLAPGRLPVTQGIGIYNRPSIDPDNVVKPRLNRQLEIRVPQDLEAKRVAVVLTLRGVAV